jgi:hypothetical protein
MDRFQLRIVIGPGHGVERVNAKGDRAITFRGDQVRSSVDFFQVKRAGRPAGLEGQNAAVGIAFRIARFPALDRKPKRHQASTNQCQAFPFREN